MSDSEGFESADEGHETVEKTERKKRQSSTYNSDSDYDDNARKPSNTATQSTKTDVQADGWEDFDVEDEGAEAKKDSTVPPEGLTKAKIIDKKEGKSQDTGWDDFGDWEQELDTVTKENQQTKLTATNQQPLTADRISVSTGQDASGWGWGWAANSLLSTATAGISNITNHVSQGISTVLETGIGAPDPEELARKSAAEEQKSRDQNVNAGQTTPCQKDAGDAGSFPFGNILSGVSKFVETTGSKVIAGGLDTLETIGKKTMEVLQDGDPGLVKKRAMLGLDQADKPVLSQVLREAKEKADEEDRIREEKREAKAVHYETLFDDFEGLVRLEALEMLSRQMRLRIEERLHAADAGAAREARETLQQVAELCDITEDDDDDEDDSTAEGFQERLLEATQELGAKLHFQPIVKVHTDALSTLSAERSAREVYRGAIAALAQSTALAMHLYHVTGELLMVKQRRSTAGEAHATRLMTLVLIKHTSELATKFTEKLNSMPNENKEQINRYITNIFLEAGNSSTYIQDAFQLTLPIIQIGAV